MAWKAFVEPVRFCSGGVEGPHWHSYVDWEAALPSVSAVKPVEVLLGLQLELWQWRSCSCPDFGEHSDAEQLR